MVTWSWQVSSLWAGEIQLFCLQGFKLGFCDVFWSVEMEPPRQPQAPGHRLLQTLLSTFLGVFC